eukprot:TRINITY_DN2915_c0_g1_i4.p1 TRINITY_DN2915_c0_g1~~TRINITY_DN2915_c0_g1_i4.p1  ORF type:complete len:345 (+),score=157.25 TRINITY_DN2915_c0_g1_i4:79-1113(+)
MGDEVDLEELMASLSPAELQALVDEMAADPDDVHIPASVRTAYRCEKEPTGDLNRDSLINHINDIALNTPDKEEKVKFEAGVKRGKVYVPKYNDDERAAMQKEESEQVRLDPDEEAALSSATLDDIMALADILNTNPQDFVMEAYADPLQYYEPEPPNQTNPQEVLDKLKSNDSSLQDVCLNNLTNITEQQMCDIFDALRNNDKLTKLSACNCDISDFAVATLCSALEQNNGLKSLSVENNRISPDTVGDLFESIASPNNGLIEVRVGSQAQESKGYRVEQRIAAAILKNPRVMKLGIKLEFKDIADKVSRHLILNMDKIRMKRLNDGIAPGAGVKWTAARTLD